MDMENEQEVKEALIAEEAGACDTPLDAKIHTAQLPPSTQKGIDAETQALYVNHRGVFRDYEDAEYFAMLPLSKEDRVRILARAGELERQGGEAKATWSDPVSSR